MNADKELEAGDELDALIAEKVMGWKCSERDCDGIRLTRCGSCGKIGHGSCYGPGAGGEIQVSCVGRGHRPSYSTDIAAAWEVVERILAIEKVKKTYLPVFLVQMAPDGCSAVLQVGMGCEKVIENASTAPLAICRLALKTKESSP